MSVLDVSIWRTWYPDEIEKMRQVAHMPLEEVVVLFPHHGPHGVATKLTQIRKELAYKKPITTKTGHRRIRYDARVVEQCAGCPAIRGEVCLGMADPKTMWRDGKKCWSRELWEQHTA